MINTQDIVNRSIPISFTKIEDVDSRFIKVKIWLCHTGVNLNSSSFSKSVIEDAIPSLANTPILGFLEDNSEGEKDFSDHRNSIVKEDGKWKIKYEGQAFGVIPENNNAKFEMKLCDDGVEREFLTCEGIVWTKWDDSIDILNRDVTKSQSMEIDKNSYSGEFKKGIFFFTKFSFNGACLLGLDVEPAMIGANITSDFSQDFSQELFDDIQEKLKEYKLLVASKSVNLNVVDDDTKVGETEHIIEPIEPLINKQGGEMMAKATENNPTDVVDPTPAKEFTITAQQLAASLREELGEAGGSHVDDWGWETDNYYYVDHDDSTVISIRTEDWKLVGFAYAMNGDLPEIDMSSGVVMKVVYAPVVGADDDSLETFGFYEAFVSKVKADHDMEKSKSDAETSFQTQIETVNTELETMKNSFATLEDEAKSLREFKATSIVAERKNKLDEVFSNFSQLSEEDVATLKTQAYESDMSIDAVEKELYSIVGRKAHAEFSKLKIAPVVEDPKPEVPKVEAKITFQVDKTPRSTKPYADIIQEYVSTKE